MQTIGRRFFASALIYGIAGMALGLFMAMTEDHSQLPTHAHIMVIGWLSFAVFGFFYMFAGQAVSPALTRLHFWLAQVSLIGLALGLWLIYSGQTQMAPLAAVSSLAYAASFLIFAANAFGALRRLPIG